ncbi:MAG: GNAT family N-acetyltransferase [Chloroflexota bacterium]
MDLSEKRRAIRHLLDESRPADAPAAYYAFYHPDQKTQLITYPADSLHATGYVALSRTGIDLFRPLVTLRLPLDALAESAELIHSALRPGAPVILRAPAAYLPLLHALFDVQKETPLRLYALDRHRFQPIINVLVTRATTHDGLPRFVIRRPGEVGTVAAADVNWQSPHFAEIAVQTQLNHRRQGWGRSVVAALCQYLLDSGRTPLYTVAENNDASIALAESVSFVDSGERESLLEAVRRQE